MNLVQHASVWMGNTDVVDLGIHQSTQEGGLLVAVVGGTADRLGPFGTVTDNVGNVYQARRVSNVDSVHVGVFYAPFAIGGAATLRYFWPAAGTIAPVETWLALFEYAGAEKETPAGVAQVGASNPPDTPYAVGPTAAPASSKGVVVAAASAYRNNSLPTPSTDYTLQEHQEATDNTAFMVADKPLTDQSGQSCTFSGVDASPYASVIVVFYDPIDHRGKVKVGDRQVGSAVASDRLVSKAATVDSQVGSATAGDS